MGSYVSRVAGMKINTNLVDVPVIQFEAGAFETDNEAVCEFLDKAISTIPAIGSNVRKVDEAALKARVADFQANNQQALKGGITSGNEAAAIAALKEAEEANEADAKASVAGDEEPAPVVPKVSPKLGK